MGLRTYDTRESRTGRVRMEKSLLAAIFIAQAMFCHADANWPLLLASAAAMGGSWLAAHYRREVFVSRTAINLAVLVLGAAMTLRYLTGDLELLIVLGHYVMLIQICKLFERKGNRDYVQMMVMSMLLVLAAAMLTHELLFGILLAGYLVQISKAAMALTVKRSLEVAERGAAGARGEAERWPARAISARLAVVVLAISVTAIVAFLAVPRGLGARAGALRSLRRPVSGFPEDVRLGQARSIYLSDRIVMRVRWTTSSGVDLGPAGAMYLRGRSYERYYDSRWEPPRDGPIRGAWARERPLQADCVHQEITMVPSLLPATFATYPALAIEAPDGAMVTRSHDHEYLLKFPGLRMNRPVQYVAKVLPPGHPAWAGIGDPDEGRAGAAWGGTTRAAPDVPVRVIDLARQWCEDLLARRESASAAERDELDLAIARRIADKLGRTCEYTLDLTGANPGRDGVEDFLFYLRRGHCEYFASAMTVMCQGLGVRARLSTGFAGGEYSGQTGSYTVRQRDAHAWTEVYTDHAGWVVVDATPGERFDPPPSSAPGRAYAWLRDTWRDWEFAWFSNVVGYDEDARRELAGHVRQGLAGLADWARQVGRDVRQGLIELFAQGRLSMAAAWFFVAVAALALLVAGLAYLWRIRPRRRRRARRPAAPKPPAFMAQLLKLLTRHGAPLAPSQTRRQWARGAAEKLRLPAEELDALIDLHEQVRWSGRDAGRHELARAEGRVRHLRDLLST